MGRGHASNPGMGRGYTTVGEDWPAPGKGLEGNAGKQGVTPLGWAFRAPGGNPGIPQ